MKIFNLGFVGFMFIPAFLYLLIVRPLYLSELTVILMILDIVISFTITCSFYVVYGFVRSFRCPIDSVEPMDTQWEPSLLWLVVPFITRENVLDFYLLVRVGLTLLACSDVAVLFRLPLQVLGFRFYRISRGGINRVLITRHKVVPIDGIHSDVIRCVEVAPYVFLEV